MAFHHLIFRLLCGNSLQVAHLVVITNESNDFHILVLSVWTVWVQFMSCLKIYYKLYLVEVSDLNWLVIPFFPFFNLQIQGLCFVSAQIQFLLEQLHGSHLKGYWFQMTQPVACLAIYLIYFWYFDANFHFYLLDLKIYNPATLGMTYPLPVKFLCCQ